MVTSGKLQGIISQQFQYYRESSIHHDVSARQTRELEKIFFSGAITMFNLIHNAKLKGDDPDMKAIFREIVDFEIEANREARECKP